MQVYLSSWTFAVNIFVNLEVTLLRPLLPSELPAIR